MKDHPILFNSAMVRAILEGRKTQTRRFLKTQPIDVLPMLGDKAGLEWIGLMQRDPEPKGTVFHCRIGNKGDRLWVRENGWERPERTPKMMREGADTWAPYYYDADGYGEADAEQFKEWGFKRRPSIHMPRWASRINLEITGVRVERLQEISKEDAIAEGVDWHKCPSRQTEQSINMQILASHRGMAAQYEAEIDYIGGYQWLWESINGPGSWDANPWVWVIEFRRVEQ